MNIGNEPLKRLRIIYSTFVVLIAFNLFLLVIDIFSNAVRSILTYTFYFLLGYLISSFLFFRALFKK